MGERLVDDALEQVGRLFKENAELRAELARVKAELDARIAAESVDAAAGSYAGRAEEAEAEVRRLRTALADLPAGWEARNSAVVGDRNYWEDQAALAMAERDEWHRQNGLLRGERDAATARAEQAEAALAELRDWYDEDTAMLQRILDAHDEDEAHDWIPDNLSRTVSEMRKSLRDRLFQREDTALERAAAEQGVPLVCDIDKLAAPEDERLSDEEWTAYVEALGIEPGDDDIDPDEVIAQNHRDAMRDWGIADA